MGEPACQQRDAIEVGTIRGLGKAIAYEGGAKEKVAQPASRIQFGIWRIPNEFELAAFLGDRAYAIALDIIPTSG